MALSLQDLVEQLDVTEFVKAYGDGETGGYPPFDPSTMLRIWIYACTADVRSSRKVVKALVGDVAYRWHLRSRERRLKAIREAKERLERDARERTAKEQKACRDAAVREGRGYHPRVNPNDAKPRPAKRRDFTDPDSRVMRKGTAFSKAYNTQPPSTRTGK